MLLQENSLSSHLVQFQAGTPIERELQSKYLNPAWIRDMQASGYDGARYMSEMTDSLSLWSTTARQSVDSTTWESVKRVYVDDQYHLDMRQYFEKSNPYARQVMLATLLDAAKRGFWQATGEEKKALSMELARSVADHGLAGTADINRNSALSREVAGSIAGLPGSTALLRSYQRATKSSNSAAPPSKPILDQVKPAIASNVVTGTLLQKVNPQAGIVERGRSWQVLLMLCLTIAGLFLIGWLRAGRETT